MPNALNMKPVSTKLVFSSSLDREAATSTHARALWCPDPPSHGIQINQKYLENVLQAEGASNSKILRKRSASEYVFYEAHEGDGTISVVATERSTAYGGHTTFGIGDFGVSRCPDGIAERVSPSDGLTCGLEMLTGKDLASSYRSKRQRVPNPPAYGPGNGYPCDRPRALIHAFGQDDTRTSSDRSPEAQLANDMNSELVSRPWQSSEEKEFDWKDMSPTLVDSRNSNPNVSSESKNILCIYDSATLDPNFSRSNWRTPVSTSLRDSQLPPYPRPQQQFIGAYDFNPPMPIGPHLLPKAQAAFIPWHHPTQSTAPIQLQTLATSPQAQQTSVSSCGPAPSNCLVNQLPGVDNHEPLGVDFDQKLIKVRHESAITAIYGDLPRQCSTCGMRLKTQKEHSNHMDWHVTKNRLSRKRKQNPCRKWFVNFNARLAGIQVLETDTAPRFLLSGAVADEKDDAEMATPANEDQTTCVLCGEPFEDFFSEETEEWMYKGAVYLNAPVGSIAGLHRSPLACIVHAKCRS